MTMRSRDMARTSARRDFNASGFALSGTVEEELDPMSGTSNLVDAMLVFACGLLLALVVKYNVPLNADLAQATLTGDMTQLDNPGQLTDSKDEGGRGFEEVVITYYDPETGTYYVKVEE